MSFRLLLEYAKMSDIKTKENTRNIKVLDRSAAAMHNVKRAGVRTRNHINNLTDDGYVSPAEYTEEKLKGAAEDGVYIVEEKTRKQVKKVSDKIKDRIREKRFEKRQQRMAERRGKKIERWVRRAERKEAARIRKKVRNVRTRKAAVRQQSASRTVSGTNAAVQRRQAVARNARATERSIKQTAKSTGKASIRTARRNVKTTQKTVKTTEQTAKAVVKTSKAAAEASKKAAETSARAARAALIATKKAVIIISKAAVAVGKVIVKAAVSVGKAIVAAFQALVAAVGAGGAVAIVAAVLICAVALILGSAEGIFFSSEDTGGRTMQSVVRDINQEYQDRLALIKEVNTYDELEMTGSSAVWREVLSVYAVSLNMASDEEQEVVTLNNEKIECLKIIFWEMNTISSEIEDVTRIIEEEQVDEKGNIKVVKVEKKIKLLKIKVSHKTAEEMAEELKFSERQKDRMHDLLSEQYRSLWAAVLYGIKSGETAIIEVAASQIGNESGEPYWSMFGFSSRIPWCACFVTWCGNECGYIENGIMPYSIGCVVSMNWYKERGQWIDGNEEPVPGMIIFYDWDDPEGEFGPQDGKPDHTGIVAKVENGIIWTIEGNSGDACRMNQYSVGEYVIMGYGCPKY